jgi:peptidoglycan hydrolase CwlO-like protein
MRTFIALTIAVASLTLVGCASTPASIPMDQHRAIVKQQDDQIVELQLKVKDLQNQLAKLNRDSVPIDAYRNATASRDDIINTLQQQLNNTQAALERQIRMGHTKSNTNCQTFCF